ncbi:Sir2 histone deacetylase Hst2 [Pseudoscourfieldia marina]
MPHPSWRLAAAPWRVAAPSWRAAGAAGVAGLAARRWARRCASSLSTPSPSSHEAVRATSRVLKKLLDEQTKGGVVVLLGAGASASAGLPDFRTPGTGLYDNLQEYNLPFAEAIFDLQFYRQNAEPFNRLARELYPGGVKPTAMHRFVSLLDEHQLLTRCFTQNIDSLETAAGLRKSMVVAAHGNFDTASCIDCGAPAQEDLVRQSLCEGAEPQQPTCSACGGKVKPGIVFFGEALPERFFALAPEIRECRLLIIAGTSLTVHPFASLPTLASPQSLRVLANRELVGQELGLRYVDDVGKNNDVGDIAFLGDTDAFAKAVALEVFGLEDL